MFLDSSALSFFGVLGVFFFVGRIGERECGVLFGVCFALCGEVEVLLRIEVDVSLR